MTAKRERPLSKWGRKKLIREVRALRGAVAELHRAAWNEHWSTQQSYKLLGVMQGLREAKRAGVAPRRVAKPYDWDEKEALCVGESAREIFG